VQGGDGRADFPLILRSGASLALQETRSIPSASATRSRKVIFMRGPRYRFPDQVRNTTRTIAARMIREGEIARSPEDLDVWIAERPEVHAPLEKGGYGSAFDSSDLYPLLAVFLGPENAPAPAADSTPTGLSRKTLAMLVGILVVVVLIVVLLL
jgi:hypothetical protein